MAQKNLISVNIPEADLKDCKAAIAVLKTKLMPYLQTLTPTERQEMPKMGEKSTSFVQKGLEYSLKNPDLVPSFLDLAALQTDVDAVLTLRDLTQDLNPITEALNDSMTLAGSEAYQGVLVFYTNAKNAMKVKAPNAATIYNDLSARFPGGSVRAKA